MPETPSLDHTVAIDTADAVQEATLDVLRSRRASGESTHPVYRAGFVASGDWR